MATKKVEIEDLGTVSLYKRRGARSIKLSLAANGEIRVSLPLWAPYRMGVDFARNKSDWIKQRLPVKPLLFEGAKIGKGHTLVFRPSVDANSIRSRIINNEVRIILPADVPIDSVAAQTAADKACIRALKLEAGKLLTMRTEQLAKAGGFNYKNVEIKRLKGRWGSCNHEKTIVLNCFLMQLPWELIDYVIYHELTHTVILAHGPEFWARLGTSLPNVKTLRTEIKSFRPVLIPQ